MHQHAQTHHHAQISDAITEITLEREPGKTVYPTPWYSITLRNDGSAIYVGKSNTARIGAYQAVVGRVAFVRIAHLVVQSHFDRLARYYGACCVADVARNYITVTSHGKRKTVDDDGKPVDADEKEAPRSLIAIERQIDISVLKANWKQLRARNDFPEHSH